MRGATALINDIAVFCQISIHTPHAGSDASTNAWIPTAYCISIHTPHAGSDSSRSITPSCVSNFNPHSPCGERPPASHSLAALPKFQSTLPMRGATLLETSIRISLRYFNPHSPCGERLFTPYVQMVVGNFNPHSPCGERPFATPRSIPSTIYFNPHSPCGERL